MYKRRLASWGCRKYIVVKAHEQDVVARTLLATGPPAAEDGSPLQVVRLPNGQCVDAHRLAKYFRRCKPWVAGPGPQGMRPPDVYYFPEVLYSSTRSYSKSRGRGCVGWEEPSRQIDSICLWL